MLQLPLNRIADFLESFPTEARTDYTSHILHTSKSGSSSKCYSVNRDPIQAEYGNTSQEDIRGNYLQLASWDAVNVCGMKLKLDQFLNSTVRYRHQPHERDTLE